MYASFQLFQTSPVIFVNVLDPDTHVKSLENYPAKVENHQAVVKEPGILLTGLTIKAQVSGSITGQARTGQAKVASGLKELIAGTDYLAQLDDNGKLVVTLLSKGDAYEVSEIQVTAKQLDPELVTEQDLIGYYDVETGKETGFEVLRQVYPMYGLVPGFLMAPGWTENPNVRCV